MQLKLLTGLALVLLAACKSGPPLIDEMQAQAVEKAVRVGQFEFDCPATSGQVVNRQTLQPEIFGGPLRAQYTVGLSGCGRRSTIEVVCSENGKQCVEGKISG